MLSQCSCFSSWEPDKDIKFSCYHFLFFILNSKHKKKINVINTTIYQIKFNKLIEILKISAWGAEGQIFCKLGNGFFACIGDEKVYRTDSCNRKKKILWISQDVEMK